MGNQIDTIFLVLGETGGSKMTTLSPVAEGGDGVAGFITCSRFMQFMEDVKGNLICKESVKCTAKAQFNQPF